MTTDCGNIKQLVQRYLDRELSKAEQQELLEHIEGCDQCGLLFRTMLALIDQVERAAQPEPPVALYDRVLANLPQFQRRALLRRRLTWAVGAVAAAAAVILVLWYPLAHYPPGTPEGPHIGPTAASELPDPLTMMSVAAAACSPGAGPGKLVAALAAGQMAASSRPTREIAPVEIALCMTFGNGLKANGRKDLPAAAGLDVIQLITGNAALRSGL